MAHSRIEPRKPKFYSSRDIDRLPQLQKLPEESRFAMKVVAHVLPMRVNNYVVEDLIDWTNVPNDPIFNLTFMQRGMLTDEHFDRVAEAVRTGDDAKIKEAAHAVRLALNPHPAGQKTANVPVWEGDAVSGVQHKYRETCLVFPSAGQTCHAYCTFCFRWPQFVGLDDLKFATDESLRFQDYLKAHKDVTDVLFTGGDPMVMGIKNLRAYIEPLLGPGFEHIQTIRIGTKSVSYWPYRYVTDPDADEVLKLFEQIVASGKHLAIMGHYNHWIEMSTDVAQEAIRRIRGTGAVIRCQSPLIRHINDSAEVWTRMWNTQVRLGCVPYYMFVERNTGAKAYFEIPLAEAYEIFREAYSQVSGLARTVRGPSMSAMPGKVAIEGITEIKGERVFVLRFIQGRDSDWVKRAFFAKFDPHASWLTDLKPAFGEKHFFYEPELHRLLTEKQRAMESTGQAEAVGD
ncbi:MAG: lysine 2,3-aminomutase [Planctomycetes bacterium]|nr:lysine 2,3-aminomutase [Planctomycetota bacterium]